MHDRPLKGGEKLVSVQVGGGPLSSGIIDQKKSMSGLSLGFRGDSLKVGSEVNTFA